MSEFQWTGRAAEIHARQQRRNRRNWLVFWVLLAAIPVLGLAALSGWGLLALIVLAPMIPCVLVFVFFWRWALRKHQREHDELVDAIRRRP